MLEPAISGLLQRYTVSRQETSTRPPSPRESTCVPRVCAFVVGKEGLNQVLRQEARSRCACLNDRGGRLRMTRSICCLVLRHAVHPRRKARRTRASPASHSMFQCATTECMRKLAPVGLLLNVTTRSCVTSRDPPIRIREDEHDGQDDVLTRKCARSSTASCDIDRRSRAARRPRPCGSTRHLAAPQDTQGPRTSPDSW